LKIRLNQTYDVEEEPFAGGGFFEVYRETRQSPPGVVVKILREDLSAYAAGCEQGYSRQRLLNTSGLFPRIEDFGYCTIRSHERFVVVEEYMQGNTLADCIGKLNDSKRRERIFKQIAYALHVLHAEGIIHRDNHSGNILLCENDRVTLLDFNTATMEGKHQDTTGSPAARIWGPFRDPSARNHADFTKKSDIYALGVVYAEQLIGKKAMDLVSVPYNDAEKLVEAVDVGLRDDICPAYMSELVKAMIHPQPSQRPSTDVILQTLETNVYSRGRLNRPTETYSRERSFGFLRIGARRLEIFVRKRDIQLLNLPPRAQLQLMVLNPRNDEERRRMLLAPQRFVNWDQIIMFARVSLPNYAGVFDEFIRKVEAMGLYTVMGFKATHGFQHVPSTYVSFTVGQAKGDPNDIASYLDPLAQHLRFCVFGAIERYLRNTDRQAEWEAWAKDSTYETAVNVSATLSRLYDNRFVRRRSATGYLGSTEYTDASNDRYVVFRGFELPDLLEAYFAGVEEGQFRLIRVVPDPEHRDLVLQLWERDIVLLRLHTRCLMPIDQSPTFISRFMKRLTDALHGSNNNVFWNIEDFEMRDGWIGQFGDPRFSVRVSAHISCKTPRLGPFDIADERRRIVNAVREQLQAMNSKSIEVFASAVYGDSASCPPQETLRFAT